MPSCVIWSTLPGELALVVAMETMQWIASLCIEKEKNKPIIALQQMRSEKGNREKKETRTKCYFRGSVMQRVDRMMQH